MNTLSELLEYCQKEDTYVTWCETKDWKTICYTANWESLEFND